MSIPFDELIVFALLLLGVVGVYVLLKLHYVFAFGLMKKTASYEKNRVKIDKAKRYLFVFLKILLVLGFGAMFAFCTDCLNPLFHSRWMDGCIVLFMMYPLCS